jgi:hypothetical protein
MVQILAVQAANPQAVSGPSRIQAAMVDVEILLGSVHSVEVALVVLAVLTALGKPAQTGLL